MGFLSLAQEAYFGRAIPLMIGIAFWPSFMGGICFILFMMFKRHLGLDVSENSKWIYLAIFGSTLLCQMIWLGALWSLQS